MGKKCIVLALGISLLLTGCGLFEGNYVHILPHDEQGQEQSDEFVSVANYIELRDALCALVEAGNENGIIYVTNFPEDALDKSMDAAIRFVLEKNPIGSYALNSVSYEEGSVGGKTAVVISAAYTHSAAEIQKILHLESGDQVANALMQALENFDDRIVMQVDAYEEMDIPQIVWKLAQEYPEKVMENPTVTQTVYGTGISRVIEVSFTYQNTRESLIMMRKQVQTVFDSASLYVSGEYGTNQKLSQLCGFLMERFEYTVETSLTPAYSLLRHGVGDSRAFANVYSAMCRRAGLTCMTVTGTRNGELWTWNMVLDDGVYYHVDLLTCGTQGNFQEHADSQMAGYVWDYSAYPKCGIPEEQQNAAETSETENNENSGN